MACVARRMTGSSLASCRSHQMDVSVQGKVRCCSLGMAGVRGGGTQSLTARKGGHPREKKGRSMVMMKRRRGRIVRGGGEGAFVTSSSLSSLSSLEERGFMVLEEWRRREEIAETMEAIRCIPNRYWTSAGQRDRDDAILVFDVDEDDDEPVLRWRGGGVSAGGKKIRGRRGSLAPLRKLAIDLKKDVGQALRNKGIDVGVPPLLQLALYQEGGGYALHLDNDARGSSEEAESTIPWSARVCNRKITSIVYIGEGDWDEKEAGGCLHLFPYPPKGEMRKEGEEEGIDIAPRPGRLVLFDSVSVLHGVRNTRKSRYALSAWFPRRNPEEE